MALFSTLELLKIDPFKALLILINQTVGTQFTNTNVTLNKISSLGETKTRVYLNAENSKSINGCDVLYTNSTYYDYDRLHFNSIFLNKVVVKLTLPTTTFNILKKISENTGLKVTNDDVIDEVVTTNNVVIKAGLNSLRFVGEFNVTIKEP